MTVSDLERRGIKISWWIYIITLERFDRIWHGNIGGEQHISRGKPRPHPSVLQIFGDPLSTPIRFDLEQRNLV